MSRSCHVQIEINLRDLHMTESRGFHSHDISIVHTCDANANASANVNKTRILTTYRNTSANANTSVCNKRLYLRLTCEPPPSADHFPSFIWFISDVIQGISILRRNCQHAGAFFNRFINPSLFPCPDQGQVRWERSAFKRITSLSSHMINKRTSSRAGTFVVKIANVNYSCRGKELMFQGTPGGTTDTI